MHASYEHFAHGADIGIRGRGATLEQAFEQAAVAMTAAVTPPERVAAEQAVRIECAAPDDELLLVDWLNALIYESATRGLLFGRFEVAVDDGRLTGTAWGERLDVARHEPTVEVKGATYSCLRVARDPDGQWTAQCVVDV